MSITSRICGAAVGATAMVFAVGLAWGEAGTTTGQVTANGGTLDVRAAVGAETKKAGTKLFHFQYGVDTETLLGEEKIRPAEIPVKWMVTVTWRQDVDEKAGGGKFTVMPPTRKEGAKAADPAKAVVVVNKNPMVAEKIVVSTKSQEMQFAGFEGTDKVKITFEDAGKPSAKGKAPTKRVKTVTTALYDKAKFFLDSEEVDKAALKDREGQVCKADYIEDGAPFPTIYRMTFKKDATTAPK